VVADAELVSRAQSGGLEALEELIERYQRPIYSFCYRMTGNHHDAQDLTQETFLRVYASIRMFRGRAPFSSWVYRIASNLCIDRTRRRARRSTLSLDAPIGDEDLSWQLPDRAEPGPELWAERSDLQWAIARGLERLTPEHRAVVVLHDLRELTYGEVAAILRCPVGTVKSRLSRARSALRSVLVEQGVSHYGVALPEPLAAVS
jgi:RNA polymerase sigma-70 factor (ECF subfamily)